MQVLGSEPGQKNPSHCQPHPDSQTLILSSPYTNVWGKALCLMRMLRMLWSTYLGNRVPENSTSQTLVCVSVSLGDFVKMKILIQQVWGQPEILHFYQAPRVFSCCWSRAQDSLEKSLWLYWKLGEKEAAAQMLLQLGKGGLELPCSTSTIRFILTLSFQGDTGVPQSRVTRMIKGLKNRF